MYSGVLPTGCLSSSAHSWNLPSQLGVSMSAVARSGDSPALGLPGWEAAGNSVGGLWKWLLVLCKGRVLPRHIPQDWALEAKAPHSLSRLLCITAGEGTGCARQGALCPPTRPAGARRWVRPSTEPLGVFSFDLAVKENLLARVNAACAGDRHLSHAWVRSGARVAAAILSPRAKAAVHSG